MDEYAYLAPFWFVNRYEANFGESVFQNLYTPGALFLARAWIVKAPHSELTKYLDVAAFARGDLIYIQNLIAATEAP